MKKFLVRGAVAFAGILVLAAVIALSATKTSNSIHSCVAYENDDVYATVEKIACARPPLAAPDTRAFSTDETKLKVVCDLIPVG